jgi:hypothetical protein
MRLPQLYQEYVGHDNNRDAYMLNTVESRVMEHAWRQWEPNIVYVHHQSSPYPTRIWLPPFAEPIATHAPYIMSREVNMIGMAIAKRLEEEGKVGATHMGDGFDAWYPGYIDYMPIFKNIPRSGRRRKARGRSGRADSRQRRARHAPAASALREPVARRPMADARCRRVHGNRIARDARLRGEVQALAAVRPLPRREESDRQGRTEAPYAYFVPQDQRDPVAAVEMLRRLAFNGVRISQLSAPITLDGTTFPAGTWVVPADQEFAAVAREVLDVQKYPEIRESPGGPLDRPYDAAGWTLPLSMGVKVVTANSPIPDDVRAKMRPLSPAPSPTAAPTAYNLVASTDAAPFDSVPGIGFDSDPSRARSCRRPAASRAMVPRSRSIRTRTNAFKAINRAWKAGATVRFQPTTNASGARYVISGMPASAQADLVKTLALTAEHVAAPAGPAPARPRVGLLLGNTSMDEGWTRWVLDQYEFTYERIAPADIDASLRTKIDVLILADDARVLETGAGRGGRGGRGGAPGAAPGAPPPIRP